MTSHQLPQAVLDAANCDASCKKFPCQKHNRYAVLSVGAETPITADTDMSVVRKAYFKLATKIHPDKIPDFPNATKAFQVTAAAPLLQPPPLSRQAC